MHTKYIKKIGQISIAKLSIALCLILLAGCSSLPVMVPDMAMQPSHPVQLDGAHGPLTAQQSKAVLARIKKKWCRDQYL
jgi:cardiolipin synthase